jgi:hypothetical protein
MNGENRVSSVRCQGMQRKPRRVGYASNLSRLINTAALARCNEMPGTEELFQQFLERSEKPLKRLGLSTISTHRAKAPVLMRTAPPRSTCVLTMK